MDPLTLNNFATGFDVFGRMFGGLNDLAAGSQAKSAADFEAAQLRQNAGQAQAVSQREAITADQQAKYVASRALALAASSGGGASDPGVVSLISNIASEGAYRKALALYQGDEAARQLNLHADAAEVSGAAAQAAEQRNAIGKFATAGTAAIRGEMRARGIAQGTSLLQKYGGNGGPLSDARTGDFARADRASPGWDGY